MNNTELESLTDEIISGRRLGAEDDLRFFTDCDLNELGRSADRLRKHFSKDRVDLCTIINGKSGRCSEDCRFCAQSAHHHTACETYPLLDSDRIIAAAKANEAEGVSRFAIVTSGRCPSDEDFEKIISIYTRMRRDLKLGLCASQVVILANLGQCSFNSRTTFPNYTDSVLISYGQEHCPRGTS